MMRKIAGLALAGLIVVGGFNFVSADEPTQEENKPYIENYNCVIGLTDDELAQRGVTREDCEAFFRGELNDVDKIAALKGMTVEEYEAFRAENRANGRGMGQGRGMGRGLGCQNFESENQ